MTGTVKRHLGISGRVQGVFFRAWTVQQAERLGVDGWVRNRGDGSVEMVASGPPDAVEALIALCRRGPPQAHVERIDIAEWEEPVAPGFTTRPTVRNEP